MHIDLYLSQFQPLSHLTRQKRPDFWCRRRLNCWMLMAIAAIRRVFPTRNWKHIEKGWQWQRENRPWIHTQYTRIYNYIYSIYIYIYDTHVLCKDKHTHTCKVSLLWSLAIRQYGIGFIEMLGSVSFLAGRMIIVAYNRHSDWAWPRWCWTIRKWHPSLMCFLPPFGSLWKYLKVGTT